MLTLKRVKELINLLMQNIKLSCFGNLENTLILIFFSIYIIRINSKDDLLVGRPSFVISGIFLLSRKQGGCRLRGKSTLALVDFNIEIATTFIVNSERGLRMGRGKILNYV